MKTDILKFFLILLFIKSSAYCQTTEKEIISNTITIGKGIETHTDIPATEYRFKDRIDRFYLNRQSNNITLQIRGVSRNGKWLDNSGEIVLFDLDSHIQKWSRKFNFSNTILSQFGNTFILNNNLFKATSNRINAETGKGLEELKHKVYYVDTFHNISMGYIVKSSGVTYNLVGVDLKNVSLKWERELKRDYYWDELRHLSDSTFLVSAAGLHSIDINTGKGWDYNTVTGERNYTRAAVTTVAGIAMGVLTGTYFYASDPDLLHGIFSNTLEDSTAFYYASKERLAKIDKANGRIMWQMPFENNEASHSNIFLINDKLVMVNFGYAYLDNSVIGHGNPFITSFNKNTGNQEFIANIGSKKNPIKSIFKKGENLLLLFNDSIVTYSMNNGARVAGKFIKKDKDEDLEYFIDNNIYYNNGDSLNPDIQRFDMEKAHFVSSQNIIYEMNDDLSVSRTFKREELFLDIKATSDHDFKFINRRNETYILDKRNKAIARLNTSYWAALKDKTLYDISDNKLIEIDLSNYLK